MSEEAKSARIADEECGILDTYTIDVLIASCSCGRIIAVRDYSNGKEYSCSHCGKEYPLQ